METIRQKQISALIQREFSNILREQGTYLYADAMVTVTRVRMTPDMGMARIYLSIFRTEDRDAVLLTLNVEKFKLRHALSMRIRNQLRKMPDIEMFIDDTLDEVQKLDKLFDDIKKMDEELGIVKDKNEE